MKRTSVAQKVAVQTADRKVWGSIPESILMGIFLSIVDRGKLVGLTFIAL